MLTAFPISVVGQRRKTKEEEGGRRVVSAVIRRPSGSKTMSPPAALCLLAATTIVFAAAATAAASADGIVQPESEGLFTSNADLQSVLYTEAELARTLHRYLEEEERKLAKVKR